MRPGKLNLVAQSAGSDAGVSVAVPMSELRSRLRHLWHNPSHVAAVVLSLGGGMAVCVSVFSLVNTLVFGTVTGVSDRRNLIRLSWTNERGLLTKAEFDAFEEQTPGALASMAAQGDRSLPIILPSGPATISAAFVSARFFETLGTQPVEGRLLNISDADGGATPVVVIGETLWRRAFNGDRDVGAHPRDIVLLVLRPGLWLVLIGVVAGLFVAAPLAIMLRSVLVGVSPLEPRALVPSVGVLFFVSLAASTIPAYRASRVDPVRALRDECRTAGSFWSGDVYTTGKRSWPMGTFTELR